MVSQKINALFQRNRFGIKLGLTTMDALLSKMGNPQRAFSAIHIAGTNGKGSTGAYLEGILIDAGYRVGFYSSPHLVKFNERFRINGVDISDEELDACFDRVTSFDTGERPVTFFEFATAMAFSLFNENDIQIAIIETGMGGRLDATNILTPVAAVITNIAMDHQAYLGDTLKKIAYEKAGIIKSGIPVISGEQHLAPASVIEETAESKNSPLYRLNQNFSIQKTLSDTFTYISPEKEITGISIPLCGDHQPENASLAIKTIEALSQSGFSVSDANIKNGLSSARWPGRIETVSSDPEIIIDGAHNEAAAIALTRYLEKDNRPTIFIVGVLDDKDASSMLKHWSSVSNKIILTQAGSTDRSIDTSALAQLTDYLGLKTLSAVTVSEAIKTARNICPENGRICIAGSLYVAGEARGLLVSSY